MSDNTATTEAPTAAPSAAASLSKVAASSAASAAGTPAASPTTTPAAGSQPAAPAPATGGAPVSGQPPVQTPQPDPAAAATGTRGPIPFDRHEAALRNARTQALQTLGIPATATKEEIAYALSLANRLRGQGADPRAFWKQLGEELGPEDQAPSYDPDLKGDNGVTAYSAGRMKEILQHELSSLRRELNGQLQPLLAQQTEAQRAQEMQRVAEQGKAVIREAVKMAEQLPHFKTYNKAIGERITQMGKEAVDKFGLVSVLYMAYAHVLAESVFPGLKSEQEYEETMKRKAATSGGAHPAGANGGSAPKPIERGDTVGLSRRMEEIAARISR